MLNRAIMGYFKSKSVVKSRKGFCRGIFLFVAFNPLFYVWTMRQCFKNNPAKLKFQSRPTFLAGFFSKRVTDHVVRRKTFFLASRGENSSLIHRVVTMEYSSSVPTPDRGSAFLVPTLLELCKNFSCPCTSKFLDFFCGFWASNFVPDHIAISIFFWSEGAVVWANILSPHLSSLGKIIVDSLSQSSSPVQTSEIEFTSCRCPRGKPPCAQRSWLVSSQGMTVWRGWSNRKGGGGVFCFHSRASIPARRLMREKQEVSIGACQMRLTRAPSFCLFRFLSLSLSLSLSFSVLKHTLPLFFSFSSLLWATGACCSPATELPRKQICWRRLKADMGSSVLHLQKKIRSKARKRNWNLLQQKKKRLSETGKETTPPPESHALQTRPHISMLILENVWYSRHVVLWRHFSRSLCTTFL